METKKSVSGQSISIKQKQLQVILKRFPWVVDEAIVDAKDVECNLKSKSLADNHQVRLQTEKEIKELLQTPTKQKLEYLKESYGSGNEVFSMLYYLAYQQRQPRKLLMVQ